MEVDLVLDARAEVGEGPVWDQETQRLLWVDITRGLVHLLDPGNGADQSFDVGQHVGAATLRASGGPVLALRGAFGLLDLDSGRVDEIAEGSRSTRAAGPGRTGPCRVD